ncbi:paraquat-inducible protein A [Geotalea uraniireducens]|uniref:Paraquat-inducible protein A n=1 Tax=Geotalea uraniireducens (strain Rf4) TaxID=351605 RepID=A5GBN6_GEOUR|nr:paraquat-inducible protein A [Geotalea uraniireducens]ABQ25016.1 Paraquat-inducible protein A [Geotalea uraniireducens Rf4]
MPQPHVLENNMQFAPIIACHECDLLQREIRLPPGRVARCSRCGAELYRSAHKSVDHPLALTLAAAVVFIVANAYPVVGLEIQGTRNDTNLLGAVHALWMQDMWAVAALVFVTTILVPAIEIAVMIHILMTLKFGRIPAGITILMRILKSVEPWGMMEVFMLGMLVALVKLKDLKDLGSRLKLPPGWKFRSPILEQDLVFMTDNGKTHITQDEIGNTYDRVGGPYSNYKP